ncbi:zinc finger, CCHC-type containing protein [Tanacetum coccineum]
MVAAAMSVVYVLTTPIPEDGENATVDQIKRRNKWDSDDYVCRDSLEAKYMADDVSNKKFLISNFTNYKMIDSRPVMEQYNELLGILGRFTQHQMNMDEEELTLVEFGSHLRIEESLRAQDSDKPKGNNFVGPQLNIVNDIGKSAFMSTSKLNDSILWHARLGHVHFKRMQDMCKDGLIYAFDIDTEKCFAMFIYLLHSKDEALDKFKVFKTEVELQQGSLIKRFKTDRGGLSQGFWGEAMLTACYLLDRVPNKRNNITPYELWTKRKPNLNYPRVWGCRAVVRLPDPNLKTLGERGIECIFVGYVEPSKAFRDEIFDENRFSSVPGPSLRIPNETKDIGGSVVPQEVTEEDDPKTFDEAMKSQDVAFRKEAINDEMDSIMGNNTYFRQNSGIYYFDTYAPVTRISTIRLPIAMALIHNLIIHQMDVKTAFLNGELDEEQAPKQWHQKFDEVVLSSGYLLNQADKCVYSKFNESGKGGIICLHVDDILIFGTDQVQVDMTKKFLSSKFSMKDMGEADVILGIRIKHESNGITISQSHYIEKVLKKFNYFDCTPVSTPVDTSEKLMRNNGQAVSQLKYSRVIGCLMYDMTCIRPDVAFVVGKVSRLTYTGYPSVLKGYTDASWISNTEDNSSTSGWIFLLGGGAISWASKKQTCITGSTMESEFVALAAAGKEAEWLKNLLLEIPLWSNL